MKEIERLAVKNNKSPIAFDIERRYNQYLNKLLLNHGNDAFFKKKY